MKNYSVFFGALIAGVVCFTTVSYLQNYFDLQRLDNFSDMTTLIKKEKPDYLYGVNDLAPALSYATGVPLLNDIVDTNESIFKKGFLNAKRMTDDILKRKTIVVGHGAHYPASNIQYDLIDGIFEEERIIKNCKILSRYPVKAEGLTNRINFFRCY